MHRQNFTICVGGVGSVQKFFNLQIFLHRFVVTKKVRTTKDLNIGHRFILLEKLKLL